METFIKAFVAYFVIVDPVGTSMIFSGLTSGKDELYARRMAVRSVLFSTVLVLLFGFWGMALLGVLGIQMESFRIAGGLLIFYAAFGMITRPDSSTDPYRKGVFEDISVYPLTIPLIAGPGCLTLTILLFSNARDQGAGFAPLILAILAIFSMTFLSFLFSKKMARLVGQTVNSIFTRLLGVILASLAIQFIADGIKALWR
ncbi:MAG: MarC family protein [bacterium]|nr:MarC family protein [bacterium]MDT8365167.1 MarC family protein [bacterium]